jgi:hypothetical protein
LAKDFFFYTPLKTSAGVDFTIFYCFEVMLLMPLSPVVKKVFVPDLFNKYQTLGEQNGEQVIVHR